MVALPGGTTASAKLWLLAFPDGAPASSRIEELRADSKAEAETVLASARTDAEDILIRARLEAENTVAHAQAEADERLRRLEGELATLRDQTETRMRGFQADTTAAWEQRRQLLEEMHGIASKLVGLADAAADREPDEPDLLEALEPKTQAETEPQNSKRDRVDSTMPPLESEEATDDGSRQASKRVAGKHQSK